MPIATSSSTVAIDESDFHSNGVFGSFDQCTGGIGIYNALCNVDWGVRWFDPSVGAPTEVVIRFDVFLECATPTTGTKTLTLNTVAVSTTFQIDTQDCTCGSTYVNVEITLTGADLIPYVPNSENILTVDHTSGMSSGSCEGVDSATNTYAGEIGEVEITK